MKEQTIIPHITMEIDGSEYHATYFVDDDILHVVINAKAYTTAALMAEPEALVRAMMIDEALKDSNRPRTEKR